MEKSKKILGCLNTVWRNKYIKSDTKRKVGRIRIQSILIYEALNWALDTEEMK